MARYRTNVALSLKGDRVERGTEIELSAEEAARLDPADISPMSDIPAPEPEPVPTDKPLAEMSAAELKERAKELGLSVSGSKADLLERIELHLSGNAETAAEEASADEEGDITSE